MVGSGMGKFKQSWNLIFIYDLQNKFFYSKLCSNVAHGGFINITRHIYGSIHRQNFTRKCDRMLPSHFRLDSQVPFMPLKLFLLKSCCHSLLPCTIIGSKPLIISSSCFSQFFPDSKIIVLFYADTTTKTKSIVCDVSEPYLKK